MMHGRWELDQGTWMDPECEGQRAARVLCPDGELRTFTVAGVPDTFFSVPVIGKLKGRHAYVTNDDGVLKLKFCNPDISDLIDDLEEDEERAAWVEVNRQELLDLLNNLIQWAEYMGGWEGGGLWGRAEDFRDRIETT